MLTILERRLDFLQRLLTRIRCGETLSLALSRDSPPSELRDSDSLSRLRGISESSLPKATQLEAWIGELESARDHHERLSEILQRPRAQAIALSVLSLLVCASLTWISDLKVQPLTWLLSVLFWIFGVALNYAILARAKRASTRSTWILCCQQLAHEIRSGRTWGQSLSEHSLSKAQIPMDSRESFSSLLGRALNGEPCLEELSSLLDQEKRKWKRESRSLLLQTEALLGLPLFLGFAPSILIPILMPLMQLMSELASTTGAP
jgi:hypothetical protein